MAKTNQEKSEMDMTPEVTTGLFTLVGALAGAAPSFISNLINGKNDERKHLRELVMKVTAENWRYIAAESKSILPFEHYMIHTAMMAELAFSEEEITASTVSKRLKRINGVMEVLLENALRKKADR